MYVCFNCDYKTEMQSKFCPHCGQPMAIVQREKPKAPDPAPERPTPVYPYYTPPTYYYPRPAYAAYSEVPIGKKIAGMVLGIVGVVLAVIAFFAVAAESGYRYGEPFAYAFVFAVLSMPGSITGLKLSNLNREDGDTSGFSMAGRITGIIGIALMGFTLFIALVMQS